VVITIGLAILGGAIGYLIGSKHYYDADFEKAMEKVNKIEHERQKRKLTRASTILSNVYDSE
jgi:hypothetical protein